MAFREFSPEILAPYADANRDRFTVSLVFGMPALDEVATPEQALRIVVRDLYACPTAGQHIWCVHDAHTGERTLHQSEDVLTPDYFRAVRTLLRATADVTADSAHGDGFAALDDEARSDVLRLVELNAWGERRHDLDTLRECLRLALEATRDAFLEWEESEPDRPYVDEFSVAPEEVAEVSDDARLAYLGRLLRTATMTLGLNTEFRPVEAPLASQAEPGSLVAVLEGIDTAVAESLARRHRA